MVLLVVKASEEEQFLCEFPADTAVTEAIRVTVETRNLWKQLNRLCQEVQKLLDSTGSNKPGSEGEESLRRAVDEAQQLIHKDQVARKVILTPWQMHDAFGSIRAALQDAFPFGLPKDSPAGKAMIVPEEGTEGQSGSEDLDAATAELWFAGKQLQRGKLLRDHLGRNEKVKAVVELQEAGMGRPLREPAMDADTQKAMLAYRFKKQEEQKALDADDELFPNSAWANSKSLKKHFSGVDTVRLR